MRAARAVFSFNGNLGATSELVQNAQSSMQSLMNLDESRNNFENEAYNVTLTSQATCGLSFVMPIRIRDSPSLILLPTVHQTHALVALKSEVL